MPAALSEYVWTLFTLAASSCQTARNAMQRDLVDTLGAAGATYVRFLFGAPFAIVFLAVERFAFGMALPPLTEAALGLVLLGAVAQMLATGLMLAAMREKSFVVTIAYTKTEPIIIALVTLLAFRQWPGPRVGAAIALATIGVMAMSWPRERTRTGWRPALLGIVSGACFALSAVGYRQGILRFETPSFVMAATTSLVAGLIMQCAIILAWLGCFDRPLLVAIARAWRRSLFAGCMGAVASQFWFLAFASSTAAKVRTLGLVEVPMAQVVNRRVFRQGVAWREYAGVALIVAGIFLLVQG
jgi:drug/metabolite transporter (DMT)-like permease